MSDDKYDKNQPSSFAESESEATMELSIHDVLNIQKRDNKQPAPSVEPQSVRTTESLPAQRRTESIPAQRRDSRPHTDDESTTRALRPEELLRAAAALQQAEEGATTEVRLDPSLLAAIRRTEEISPNAHESQTSIYQVPSDLLKRAASLLDEPSSPVNVSRLTEELPSVQVEPLSGPFDPLDAMQTLHERDEESTRPVGRPPIEAIATIDPQGRLVIPLATLQQAKLKPGQKLKILAYIIDQKT
jgi:hypothetical protein